jgi:heme oxygenase
MRLKEATQAKHTEAENTEFAKLLISGNITKEEYAKYLYNVAHIYHHIEWNGDKIKAFEGMEGLKRVVPVGLDYNELHADIYPEIMYSAHEYGEYMDKLVKEKPQLLMAHIYVRYLGDLYGGQMIKRKVPGSGKVYDFENAKELKETLRSRLSDELIDESIRAYEFTIKLYNELWNSGNK